MDTKEQRTKLQNKAAHKHWTMLADELNGAGLEMKKVLKPEVEIRWNGNSVKEYLFRPIMTAMFGKTSTTELTTKELTEATEVLSRHLGEKFGIHVPFPSVDEQMIKDLFNIPYGN
jgi:hypothetical protein